MCQPFYNSRILFKRVIVILYKTSEELLHKAKQAKGLTFSAIDKTGRIQNNKSKGHLGHIIEESFFEYEINSDKEADFEELGIELKVTPIKQNKNRTLSAKERLVLNIINYNEEYKKTFIESGFWKKNQKLLLMFYHWTKDLSRKDYKIIEAHLHQFSKSDLKIIKEDWHYIVNKIAEGQAHHLSEGDTTYLGAVTKGASKNSLRTQPFSDAPAMQRAFSLKQSYMTALVRQIINHEELFSLATNQELEKLTLDEIIKHKFEPYFGKTVKQISKENQIEINPQSKSFVHKFIITLLNLPEINLNQIEEFQKANIVPKTIRLEPNDKPEQHMSFHNIDFSEWLNNDWENSEWKLYFESTKFLFFIFEYKDKKQKNKRRNLYFKGIKLWNMPKTIIDNDLYYFWNKTKDIIQDGIEIKQTKHGANYRNTNNLPKARTEPYFHLRPKGQNSQDVVTLPDGQIITKQCFWFNRDFVIDIINEAKTR